MFSACGPFWPWVTSNSTRWFSSRLRKPRGLDRREVGEDVGAAVVRGDEAEALVSVEPLDGANCHLFRLLDGTSDPHLLRARRGALRAGCANRLLFLVAPPGELRTQQRAPGATIRQAHTESLETKTATRTTYHGSSRAPTPAGFSGQPRRSWPGEPRHIQQVGRAHRHAVPHVVEGGATRSTGTPASAAQASRYTASCTAAASASAPVGWRAGLPVDHVVPAARVGEDGVHPAPDHHAGRAPWRTAPPPPPASGRPTRWPGSLLQLGQPSSAAASASAAPGSSSRSSSRSAAEALLQPGVEGGAPPGVRRWGGAAAAGAAAGQLPRVAAQRHQLGDRQVAGQRHLDRAGLPGQLGPLGQQQVGLAPPAPTSGSPSASASGVGRPTGRPPVPPARRSPARGRPARRSGRGRRVRVGEEAADQRRRPRSAPAGGGPSGSAGQLARDTSSPRRVDRVLGRLGRPVVDQRPPRRPARRRGSRAGTPTGRAAASSPSPHQYPEQSSSRRGRVTATYASRRSSRSSWSRQAVGRSRLTARARPAGRCTAAEVEHGQPVGVAAQRERQHPEPVQPVVGAVGLAGPAAPRSARPPRRRPTPGPWRRAR